MLAVAWLAVPAKALVTLNDGTDKIYVSGSFSMGYDTNIGADSSNTADFTTGGSVGIEYQRRAGLIGVNANVNFTVSHYLKNTLYDATNPTYSLEFDKNTGRTTGTLGFNAVRSSQEDATVNLHTESWNYNANLNVKYPVIDRYSLSESFNYGLLDYVQKGNQPLVNLSTLSSSTSLYYVLSEERDLSATYRYRFEQSSSNTSTTDNALTFGVSGKVFWEINGSINIGWQIRTPSGTPESGVPLTGSFEDWTASGSLTWALNRKVTFTSSLSNDYATTATDATTETTAVTLDATYAYNAKISINANTGVGENRFLGPGGLITGTDIERRDYYFTYGAGTGYSFGERLKLSLSYTYFKNWSNLSFAAFTRNSVTLSLSTRW